MIGTRVGTLISKSEEKLWDIDIKNLTLSHSHHIGLKISSWWYLWPIWSKNDIYLIKIIKTKFPIISLYSVPDHGETVWLVVRLVIFEASSPGGHGAANVGPQLTRGQWIKGTCGVHVFKSVVCKILDEKTRGSLLIWLNIQSKNDSLDRIHILDE